MKTLLLIAIFLLLIGCATNGNYGYTKPGVSQQQLNKDVRQCEMYGKAHSNMNPFLALDLINYCMMERGY